jgi:hypothetical protein
MNWKASFELAMFPLSFSKAALSLKLSNYILTNLAKKGYWLHSMPVEQRFYLLKNHHPFNTFSKMEFQK